MKLKFSKWTKFLDRETLTDVNSPGVYLLAVFEQKPCDNTDYTSSNIVYIGESTEQTILARLNAFQSSALQPKIAKSHNHSGGKKYNKDLLKKYANTSSNPLPEYLLDDLYVAILPVKKLKKGGICQYIKYIERLAIWKFSKNNNNDCPKYNNV